MQTSRYFRTLVGAGALTAGSFAAAGAANGPSPAWQAAMARFTWMQGTYTCTTRDHQKYTEVITHPAGGAILVATDSQNGKVEDQHTLAFSADSKTWLVLNTYGDGGASVNQGTDSSHLRGVLPGDNTTLTFAKLSPSSYNVRVSGTYRGETVNVNDTCSK
jgi:hypothetical protein